MKGGQALPTQRLGCALGEQQNKNAMNVVRQFIAALVDGVAEIARLRESIVAHTSALRAKQECGNLQHQPPPELKAEIRFPDTLERQKRADYKKTYVVQTATAMGTWLAFIAASIYAGIAACQLHEMKLANQATQKTAGAAQQSADTAENSFRMERRRTEDVEEAICGLSTGGFGAFAQAVQVSIANGGKVTARDLVAHLEFSLRTVPSDKKIRKLGNLDVSASELARDSRLDKTLDLPLTRLDWEQIADTNQVIEYAGVLRYDNGFNRTITQPVCNIWLFYRSPEDSQNPLKGFGFSCDRLGEQLRAIARQKEQRLR